MNLVTFVKFCLKDMEKCKSNLYSNLKITFLSTKDWLIVVLPEKHTSKHLKAFVDKIADKFSQDPETFLKKYFWG